MKVGKNDLVKQRILQSVPIALRYLGVLLGVPEN